MDTKIMDIYMPKTLVIAMNTLFEERGLKSWSITGGKLYTQVTIRFSPDTCIPESMDTVQRTKYKRVPPSQLKRDATRANTHRMDTHHDINPNNSNQTQRDYDATPIDVSTMHSIEADDNVQVNTEISHKASMPTPAQHGNISAGDINSNHNESSAEDNSDSDGKSMEDSEHESGDEEENCCVCESIIKTTANSNYFVCSMCTDATGIFYVCCQCYERKKHADHQVHTTKMTIPSIRHGFYCSQCGFVFKTSKSCIYACVFCSDIEYEICPHCYKMGLHSQHHDCFQKLTRKDLEAYDNAAKIKQHAF